MNQSEESIDVLRFHNGLVENMRSRNDGTISPDEVTVRVNRGLRAVQCSSNGRTPNLENSAVDDTDFGAAVASLNNTDVFRINNGMPSNYAPQASLNQQDGRLGDHSWVPRPPAAEYELNRLTTFRNWPATAPVTPQALARAGFFYTGREDMVECYCCQGQIKSWEYGDTAMGEHKKHFPRCAFVKNAKSHGNVPMAGMPDFSKVSASGGESAGAAGGGVSNKLEEKESSLFTANDAEKLEKEKRGNEAKNQVTKRQSEKTNRSESADQDDDKDPMNAADKQTKQVFKSEFKRLLSYQSFPESSNGNPKDCAKAGFFFTGKDDVVQCFACYGKIGRFKPGDSPMVEHNRHFPSCPYVLGLAVGNEPITSVQLASAIQAIKYREPTMFGQVTTHQNRSAAPATAGGQLGQTAKPTADWSAGQSNQKTQKRVLAKVRHPQFSSEQVRLESYERWPPEVGIAPIQLSRAGFFYTGSNDSCKCFYCDGGLKNWEPKDEPWMEHARWFPRCEWLIQQRGQAYVDYVVHNFPPPRVSAEVLSAGGYRKKFGPGGSSGDNSEDEAGNFQTAKKSTVKPGGGGGGKTDPPPPEREPEAGVARVARGSAPAAAAAAAAANTTEATGVEAMMTTRMTQTAKDMGYSTGLIRAVIHQRWNTTRKTFANAQDLLEAIFVAESEGIEPEDEPVLPEEGAATSAAGHPAVLSSVDIEDILNEFSWSQLEDVYVRLGLEDKDIQNERLATSDRRGQERKILHLWLNRADAGATRERMIAAMEQVPECRASLNRLKERWNNRSSASSNDDVSNLAKDIKNVKLGGASSGAAGGAASNKAPCGLEAPSGNGDLGDPPLPNSVMEIRREMDRMRDSQLCKICMDNDMSTVFLPCNHMVACDECSQALSNCPICRKKIRNVVHIFKT